MARGWTFGKIVIVILLTLVVVLAGVGWYVWSKHVGPLIQGGRAMRSQGTEFGRTADANGCLVETFKRYGEDPGTKGGILARIFLDSCLSTSGHSEGFCEGVPATGEIVASARWRVSVCGREGHGDDSCHMLLEPVQEYCDVIGAGAYEQEDAGEGTAPDEAAGESETETDGAADPGGSGP